jgi:hypothetical protein
VFAGNLKGDLTGRLPFGDLGKRRKSGDNAERIGILELRQRYSGVEYIGALDADRIGARFTPIHLEQLVSMLREEGHRIERISERLWKMDGETVSTPDLLERAAKIDGSLMLTAA